MNLYIVNVFFSVTLQLRKDPSAKVKELPQSVFGIYVTSEHLGIVQH